MKRQAVDQVSDSPKRLREGSSFEGGVSNHGSKQLQPLVWVSEGQGADEQASDPSQIFHSIVQDYTKLNDDVYELHKPASGSPNLELVFFPGFQFSSSEDAFFRTWMTRDASQCWLNTLLVELFPQARILSVSYDSGTLVSDSQGRLDMYLIRENLVQSLIDLEGVGQNCPVILVGHCVGGLVLQEVCLRASECTALSTCPERPYKQFLDNLRGVFFYSTPHSGAHIPVRAPTDGGGPLLEYLHLLNKSYARINDEFMKLRHKYECQTRGLYAANETRTSKLLHLTDQEFISSQKLSSTPAHIMVVEEGSGRFDVDTFFTIFGVDHFTICSPVDRQSSNFLLLVHFLEEILREEESCGEILCHLQLPLHLVSCEGRLSEVIKLLDLGNPKPIKLSLVGMDGIGKSTLAKQILMHIRNQFDFVCFLEFEDIQKKPKWEEFEKLVAASLFRGRGRKVSMENKASWSLLKEKRVLVLADAVESEDQILPLITSGWCGEDSRLIITTCVRGLMYQHDFIEYDVPLMSSSEAEELFKAKMTNSLLEVVPDGKKLVSEVIAECGGLPIALNLLGCHLWKLELKLKMLESHPRTKLVVQIWRDALVRMRKANALDGKGGNQVWHKLKVIFDNLDETEKTIFLDLATFDYYGPKKEKYDLCVLRTAWSTGLGDIGDTRVMRILTISAIENLRDRQLTKGRNLEDSRQLWELNEGGTAGNLETLSIMLGPSQSSLDSWNWGSIQGFSRLGLFRMSHVNMREDYDEFSLPRNLAMVHMIHCSGPTQRSWARFLSWRINWPIRKEDVEFLHRLSVLVFEHCNMVRLPNNFHRLQNLRILQIHDESMTELPKTISRLPALEDFTLTAPVESLPNSLLEMPTLRKMEISSCSFLRMWPTPRKAFASCQLGSLVELNLVDLCALVELPDSFGGMRSLKTLSLRRCSALRRLPDGFGALQELRSLVIEDCVKLEELCESFHNLRQLKRFSLSGLPALQMLPTNFGLSPSLEYLRITKCRALMELPQSFLDIQSLVDVKISACEGLTPEKLSNKVGQVGHRKDLSDLSISDCEKLEILPETVGQLECLQYLKIGGCPNLKVLPDSIGQLENLESCTIVGCEKLETLPETLGQLKLLEDLTITGCAKFKFLPDSLGQLKYLNHLKIVGCEKLETLPETLGNLESLRNLVIRDCPNLTSLPMSMGKLKCLFSLDIGCANLKALPKDGCTKLNDEVYELYKPASGSPNLELVFFPRFQFSDTEDAFFRTWMTRDGSQCWLNTWLVPFS
ncbi:hypothetical protein R1flu_012779 [Riccia fluitans]|uniref:NB-ARC domain-containing protein n=1 Tax=Riccia fluitans TaxID=41844 RepID=A0ABD1ZBK3_9MARC